MSGLCGLFHLDGAAAEPYLLRRMTRRLAHRGPDGAGLWTDGPVGLGQCMHHTTPEALRQKAPLVSADHRFVLTADARLDNRDDLIHHLGWTDRPGTTISDEHLLLGAYQRWGTRCPEHLLGDFAFALWDAREQRLFCARDHLGLKPFYYVHTGETFAFASEIKALLALPWVARRLNETRVADFLMQMHQDTESTFYDEVYRLPPAHMLMVTPDGAERRRYWALDPGREIHYATDEEYAEAFRERFVEAVRCRLRSAAPVGAMLSGGLDSSAVTGVARALLESDEAHPLDTFSLVFDAIPRSDERAYIEAVVKQGGLRPHYIHGDRLRPLADLDRMLDHLDEPFLAPNLFLFWELYRKARACGVRVLLDGFLGDNVVSHGSRYLTELAATGRWLALAREMRAIAPWVGGRRKGYPSLMRRFVLTPLVQEPLQRLWVALTRPALPTSPYSRFLNADFARRLGWMARARAFKEESPRTPLRARTEHAADLASGALPTVFEIFDKTLAAFGMTVRFPFADRRLLEYCLTVPVTQKYRDGWTRVYARDGLRSYLPEEVRTRYGKKYLHLPFQHGLFVLDRAEMDTLVFERMVEVEPYVEVEAVQQAYRDVVEHRQYGRYAGHEEVIVPIWSAVVLARWLERARERAAQPAEEGGEVVEQDATVREPSVAFA